ncbi:hypothetical protein OIU74_002307 [Salix koriyanagi]|uniref:Uncharacterized protein n=1 Tax=Salix koriyanagi TaxID=2511006 RepID=A0A9Q0X3B1_9ROSI|nr:hypothetical protein OIU74_002307 [Salix koriyanagi]
MECQDSDAFELDLVKHPLKKLDPEAPDKISTGRSTSISAEELSMVLKHYGLDCQDENEKHLPAETYFGSARHWISSATGG